MKAIRISDTTIKTGVPKEGNALSFREKIELAKLLDKLGLTVIELDAIENRKTDSLLVKSVAMAVKDSILAVPVKLSEKDSPEISWNALKDAYHPRLQVPAGVSAVQMEYFHKLKPDAMVKAIEACVAACKSLCNDVEFIAQDAGRSDRAFLLKTLQAAAAAGATTITVCDTAGSLLPDEFSQTISEIKSSLPQGVALGVDCSNAMFMADANAMAALRAGADEIKTSACGSEKTSLQKLVRILQTRGDSCGFSHKVRSTELERTSEQIQRICETQRSKASPFDSGVRDDNHQIRLSIHDDAATVRRAAQIMGYDLSDEDAVSVYEAFKEIASRKEDVGARELDAIVASASMQVPPTFVLESFVINSGNVITATAHIKMKRKNQVREGICVGDGPIDASFLAIEQIVGCHYELDDFQIQAVTEGREAMGETIVRLRSQGKVYSGRGISTDIVGSSISAYINAVNKIVYEEANV